MVDLVWPDDLRPFRVSFYLQPHTGGSESPLTRTRKTYGLSAPRWICRMTFRGGYDGFDGYAAYGPRLDAFIAQMKGGQNRVAIWDFRRPYPVALRRYYSQFTGELYTFGNGETFELGEHFFIPENAEPTNLEALAGATEMTFVGFKPGERVFNWGDYIGGDGRTHIALGIAYADGDGKATVSFEPPLVTDVPAGTAKTMQPTSWFQITSDDAGQNESEVGQAVTYTLDFVEDLT